METLFEIQGAISTLGEHLVNPDCVAKVSSAAELYYSKQQAFAMMPFFLTAGAFVFWFLVGLVTKTSFFRKRIKRDETTTKDKFVVTVTSILYLLYPTLCKNTFGLFDCKWIGGTPYLKADLEETCGVGRHLGMMLTLGVGQLIVYVIGLPLVVLLFLHRNRENLGEHASLAR